MLAQLDVLRAVAERLIHGDAQALRVTPDHITVKAIAPTGMQLDAQQADGRTVLQRLRGRIARAEHAIQPQQVWLRGMGKADRTFEDAGPGAPLGVYRAQQQERQLPVEIAVLVGHMVADHPPAKCFHTLGNTHALL
nr:hypothetical protein [Aeromonas sp.]